MEHTLIDGAYVGRIDGEVGMVEGDEGVSVGADDGPSEYSQLQVMEESTSSS